MKKVIIIILFVLVIGAGAFGTFHFYKANKNQIQQNAALSAQNAQVQAQLDAIGQLVTCYEVVTNVHSGAEIKETDLVAVSVPASTLSEASITDPSQLIGKFYKVDVKPGTILSADMLMDEDNLQREKYSLDILLTSLPVGTVEGDYVDFRLLIPNGENYIVMSHKRLEMIYDNMVTIKITEEERWLWDAALLDLSLYQQYGCVLYCTKYLEPGLDTDMVAMYPVQHDQEEMIAFNPNISDPTRCVNSTLRDHIDKVLLLASDSDNQQVSTNITAIYNTQLSACIAAGDQWKEQHLDENGNIVVEGDPNAQPTDDGSGQSFEGAVNEASDDLQTNIDALTDVEDIK